MTHQEIKVGDKVIGNGGYEGRVTQKPEWTTLVTVRYPGGEAVNDPSELIPAELETV